MTNDLYRIFEFSFVKRLHDESAQSGQKGRRKKVALFCSCSKQYEEIQVKMKKKKGKGEERGKDEKKMGS